MRPQGRSYPAIAEYGLIGDCHTAALVSRGGSIDWCCLPRFDSDSCFGRMLDWRQGGYFEIAPKSRCTVQREYLPDSLILVTTFRSRGNEARLIDFFAMRKGGRQHPRRELVRILQGVRGSLRFSIRVSPRLDFGEVKPWTHRWGKQSHVAIGSNTGLLISGDIPLELLGEHDLQGEVVTRARKRYHLALQFFPPESLDGMSKRHKTQKALDRHLDETRAWWKGWASKIVYPEQAGTGVVRSAIVLKALTFAPTGAIIAAPTTSLPEHVGGERNWDYRFSWIRDSVFTVHALSDLGLEAEAEGFRRFVARSAAGNADELQVAYAVDGKRRLTEITLDHLSGWRGSHPVRIGNAAEHQFQGDMYGLMLELAWRWSQRGNSPAAHFWEFLVELVDAAIEKWKLPDYGMWEVRSRPRHFVHSKVLGWAAVNRGVQLAERHKLPAPLKRWRRLREEMRKTIEKRGVDAARGIFVQSFDSKEVDASLVLLPSVGFVPYNDARMLRTVDVICRELTHDGLILRYRTHDGLRGQEGAFVACTFWVAECLARQRRMKAARMWFKRACAASNDLGLFGEEYQPRGRQILGNFPQGLTHLAHISAALAICGPIDSGVDQT